MSELPNQKELLQHVKKLQGPFSLPQLLVEFDLDKSLRADLKRELVALERLGQIEKLRGRFWRIPIQRPKNLVTTGTVMISRNGTGFVRPTEPMPKSDQQDDVRVQENDLNSAMDGDTVEVECWYVHQSGWRGRVQKVIKRARETMIGQYQEIGRSRGIVIPRNPFLGRKISVHPPDPALKVKHLEWVSVKIEEYTPSPQDLRGRIVERLGASHEQGLDVLLLLRDRGIIPEFPPYVEEAAEALELGIEEALPNRVDLRNLPTATIDPATAKDFDDAMSIELIGNRRWRLYVHIADVAHYVRPGSFIDTEARERSTSVYPVDRVVPMLPEKLSNDLCSLRPRVERLAMTAEMVVENDGRISSSKFYDSVIFSDHRFAYEEVQAIFEGDLSKADVVPKSIMESLPHLLDCSRMMRSRRFKNGALDLDIPESKLLLDVDKRPVGFQLDNRFEAHKVVEDCMLAANEAVATCLTEHHVPFLYRIHEPADPDRLFRLRQTLNQVGVNLPVTDDGEISSFDLQKALASLTNQQGAHILRRIMLRAMKRAEYNPTNQGHYGLASECYCHFTSPIRRYPDVIAHRQLKSLVNKTKFQYTKDEEGRAELVQLGHHTSTMERQAADAERETIKIKMMEFHEDKIGEVFEGLISGITSSGFFVEVQPSGFEGFVSVRSLRDDRYEEDEFGIALIGKFSGKRYELTQNVVVRLVRCNPFELKVDFELEPEEETKAPSKIISLKKRPPTKSNFYQSTFGKPTKGSTKKQKKSGKIKKRK